MLGCVFHWEDYMFMFDIETLGVESTCVVLSAAIIHVEDGRTDARKYKYQELLDDALFVKFDVAEQIKQLKRTIDKGTMDWWSKQHDYVKKVSLTPSADDVTVVEGIGAINSYIAAHGGAHQLFWARGSLDQMGIDSLCKSAGLDLITRFNNWRDVRTAVDLMCSTAKDGYCQIPDFDKNDVIKHHPTHDCAYDIMMMLYGK